MGLKEWVPSDWKYAHYDPEFITFTWGDYARIRTSWARKLHPNDYYFFIGSLRYNEEKGVKRESDIDQEWAYYLIGFFEMKLPPRQVSYPISDVIRSEFPNNAHVRRSSREDDRFLIFCGSKRSRLLDRAIPLSHKRFPNDLAKKVMPWLSPSSPRWWQGVLSEEAVDFILNAISN